MLEIKSTTLILVTIFSDSTTMDIIVRNKHMPLNAQRYSFNEAKYPGELFTEWINTQIKPLIVRNNILFTR